MTAEVSDHPITALAAAAPTREQIERLQATMLPIATAMPEAVHHFAPGMYGREFSMPAGMLVVGKIHKHGHIMMVVKGRATVLDEFGRYEVAAGFVQASRPGAKRVVLAHEDTTFVTVHLNPTDTQDLVLIEAEHIEPESAEFQALMAQMTEALQ
jgi:quercetin dioxygenase-like cupin family protein